MVNTKIHTKRHNLWKNHLNRWNKSGLTQAEYCRKNDLCQRLFSFWKKKLNKKLPAVTNSKNGKVKFIEARLLNNFNPEKCVIELERPDGVKMRIFSDKETDSGYLNEIKNFLS